MIYVHRHTVPIVFSTLRLCHQPSYLVDSCYGSPSTTSLLTPLPQAPVLNVLHMQTNPPKCSATQGMHADSLITDTMYIFCS